MQVTIQVAIISGASKWCAIANMQIPLNLEKGRTGSKQVYLCALGRCAWRMVMVVTSRENPGKVKVSSGAPSKTCVHLSLICAFPKCLITNPPHPEYRRNTMWGKSTFKLYLALPYIFGNLSF